MRPPPAPSFGREPVCMMLYIDMPPRPAACRRGPFPDRRRQPPFTGPAADSGEALARPIPSARTAPTPAVGTARRRLPMTARTSEKRPVPDAEPDPPRAAGSASGSAAGTGRRSGPPAPGCRGTGRFRRRRRRRCTTPTRRSPRRRAGPGSRPGSRRHGSRWTRTSPPVNRTPAGRASILLRDRRHGRADRPVVVGRQEVAVRHPPPTRRPGRRRHSPGIARPIGGGPGPGASRPACPGRE